MKIILLGPPGAGKGTEAKVLAEKYGVEHISTGDIFRESIKEESPLGLEIKKYVESGELIPDKIVVEVVTGKIRDIDLNEGFILDGFPRTINQAQMLDFTLEKLRIRIDKVIYFDTSLDVVLQRLTNRRICRQCGTIYHLVNMPPAQQGKCDRCGGDLFQREDDMKGTILNRLKVYKEQTAGLINYYQEKKMLEKVNGDISKDELFEVISSIVDNLE